MKILLIHNRYQQRGGEDLVFETEGKLLAQYGHTVDHLIFSNDQIKTLFDKLSSAIGCVYNIRSRKAVSQKIREFQPDVIHVHNFFHLASPSIFFAAKRHKVPIVMTLHNYRLICPSATLFHDNNIYEKSIHKLFPWDAIRKGVYRNSRLETTLVSFTTGIHKLLGTWKNQITFYIALTEFAKRKFLDSSLKLKAEKIIVKPNFVEDFGANISEREDFYLFIGRLSSEKGITKLIDTAIKLPNIEFRIIGDGPLKQEVEAAALENKNIVYLGFKNKEFIIDQLKKTKALLFPSLWYEGFPMTILEAFSCGTPVIASDLGGPKEIINDGINGLLFDYESSDDLVRKIAKIGSGPDLHSLLCRNARNAYENLYTPEKNYQQLIKIYKTAIEKR